jgi:hypothetical protein
MFHSMRTVFLTSLPGVIRMLLAFELSFLVVAVQTSRDPIVLLGSQRPRRVTLGIIIKSRALCS